MQLPINKAIGTFAPGFLAGHDSATAMVESLSKCLNGKPAGSPIPAGRWGAGQWYAKVINALPAAVRQKLYAASGMLDAISASQLDTLDAEEFCHWVYNLYPERKYPAIAIGSSNGALIHLCAALGIPWLPQTMLIPIRKPSTISVDEPLKTMEWAIEPGEAFLRANPYWQLHHMIDPVHDRLRSEHIAYFRTKKLRLGGWYERFIRERLRPGGTLLIFDCQKQWEAVTIGDRHYFQLGGDGGIEDQEYYQGSDRIAAYLQAQQADINPWDTPTPTGKQPEAEWGFASALLADIKKLSQQQGYTVQTIGFTGAQDPSAWVADLHRWWYPQVGIRDNRLLVQSFSMQEPYWALRTGSIPYWTVFSVDTATQLLEDYLKSVPSFDEIYVTMLSHGNKTPDEATVDSLNALFSYATRQGGFIGTDPEKYPKDIGVYARYTKDTEAKIKQRYPVPCLSLVQLRSFVEQTQDKYAVTWH